MAVVDDSQVEGDETITLTLQNPTGGASLGAPSTAVLTIIDSDSVGTLQFSTGSYLELEVDGQAIITVTRTNGSNGQVSAGYRSSGGSATAGQDYTPVSETLVFGDGMAGPMTFTIPISEDGVPEGDETIILLLENPTGGATLASPMTATLTLIDDDHRVYLPLLSK